MNTRDRRLSLLLALLLGGCATVPPSSHCTSLAASVSYCTQPLPEGLSLSLNQLVSYSSPKTPQADPMVFAIEATGGVMHVAALTTMGQTLFRLDLDGGALSWEGPAQVAPLAEALPAMIQLALWPEQSARLGLRGGELEPLPLGRRILGEDNFLVLDIRHTDTDPTRGELDMHLNTLAAHLHIRNLAE